MNNQYKVLFSIIVLLVLGFFITSYLSYTIASQQTKDQLKYKSLPLSSDNVYSEIQRDLLKPNLVASLMAYDTFMIDWIKNGEKDIHQIQNYLKAIKDKYETSSSFFVSDKTKIYYYPKGILKKISPSNKRDEWFYRVKNITEEFEANIDKDFAANDSLTIFTNFRVTDKNGKFLGVTGVGLNTSHVNELLKTYKNKYSHNVYFINKKNKLILSSQKDSVLNNQSFLTSLINEFNKQNHTTIEKNHKDENFIFNIRYIDELNLYLLIEAKENSFTKEIKETFYKNIIILLIIVLIIIAVVFYNINSSQKKLRSLATTDKLTKISNRYDFDIKFESLYHSNRKQEKKFSLILLDIDDFKKINDEFGHHIGDKVLEHLSIILKSSFRQTDTIARWGGEEFIILLNNTDLQEAYNLAERLRLKVFSSTQIQKLVKRKVSVSLGVVSNQINETKENLFIRADKNMYKAKKEGKNKTVKDLLS